MGELTGWGGGMADERREEAEPSFEVALGQLDRVVARLEGGEVGLEEAVDLFEQGQAHLEVCRRRLAAVRERIVELTADGDGPAGDGVGESAEPGL